MSHDIYRMLLGGVGGGGGGGGSGTIWDDDFTFGSSIDITGARFASAKPWTVYGAATITTSVSAGEVTLTTSSSGFWEPRGAYQDVPVGDWTFVAECHMPTIGIDELIGVFLMESATGKRLIAGMGRAIWFGGGPQTLGFRVQDNGTKYSHTDIATFTVGYDALIRVSRTSGTLLYEYSLDSGGSWTTGYTQAQTVPFTTAPDRIGIATNNTIANNGNTPGYFRDWKRTA